jgi:hypothetical protein
MGNDAVVLFRPKDPNKLRPFLDLDDESDESEGLYAEELDDGSVLVHTFQPYAVFAAHPNEGRSWLGQFGPVLPFVHDDPRGLLFFPEACDPSASTYDEVVLEIGERGTWVPQKALSPDEARAYSAANARELEELRRVTDRLTGESEGDEAPPPAEVDAHAFAAKLLAGEAGDVDPSFAAAKLLESVQKRVLEAFGMGGEGAGDELSGGVALLVKRSEPLDLDDDASVTAFGHLEDGTAVIESLHSPELLAVDLGGRAAEWTTQHHDPRGIPTFPSERLDDVLDASSYDEALSRLADVVTFVQPVAGSARGE